MVTKKKRPKRARSGPKPMPEHERRSHVLSVRLTQGQLEDVWDAAGKAEMTVVDWVVKRLMRGLPS